MNSEIISENVQGVFITADYEAIVECLGRGIPVIQVVNSRPDSEEQKIFKRKGFNQGARDPLDWSHAEDVLCAVKAVIADRHPGQEAT